MKIDLIFTCIEQNDLLPKFLTHYQQQGCDNAVCLIERHIDEEGILNVFPNALIYKGKIRLKAV